MQSTHQHSHVDQLSSFHRTDNRHHCHCQHLHRRSHLSHRRCHLSHHRQHHSSDSAAAAVDQTSKQLVTVRWSHRYQIPHQSVGGPRKHHGSV